MLFDLHNHSICSHDGFTSEAEMIEACLVRGINAIAVTEHDKACTLSRNNFAEHDIELITGCEFTTDKGAHIIGLFISEGLPALSTRALIISHIKAQGGLLVMPHPWKTNSGYMVIHGEDEFLKDFDMIELLNGGWNSQNHIAEIINLAEMYEMLMVSSSDSHRGCQVGLCATKINTGIPFEVGTAKKILSAVVQDNVDLQSDEKVLAVKGRKPTRIQLNGYYQQLLPLIPERIKRVLKVLQYKYSNDSTARPSSFITFNWKKND